MLYPGCCSPKYCGGTAGLRGVAVYGVSGDSPRESMFILAPSPRPESNKLQFMGGVMGTLARTPSLLAPIYLSSHDCDSSTLSSLPARPRMSFTVLSASSLSSIPTLSRWVTSARIVADASSRAPSSLELVIGLKTC
ncbi:hypothetical protein PC120_g23260 [Phytophthora cactorum]|nr:hypothetical protein PC120_g23260 [Phytophthora cactorum]